MKVTINSRKHGVSIVVDLRDVSVGGWLKLCTLAIREFRKRGVTVRNEHFDDPDVHDKEWMEWWHTDGLEYKYEFDLYHKLGNEYGCKPLICAEYQAIHECNTTIVHSRKSLDMFECFCKVEDVDVHKYCRCFVGEYKSLDEFIHKTISDNQELMNALSKAGLSMACIDINQAWNVHLQYQYCMMDAYDESSMYVYKREL